MSDQPDGGALWLIEARKYDNSLHYTMPAYLLHDDGAVMWFRVQVGGELRHFTRGWTKPIIHATDMIFWRDQWYNAYLNFYPEPTTLDHIYCNVGLPPTITGQTISYVDLDLDVQFWPDGRYELLDEDEFIEHAALFAYPQHVQQAAWQAIDDLLTLWRTRTPPMDRLFNGAK